MKSAIRALFLDIGGVLGTNGWDRPFRAEAAERFGLDHAEMDERHHLTFDTYEEGKLTLDEYLKRESLETIQNSFKSGIVIFGQVVSDNELIKTEIYGFFDKAIKNILEWEKAQSK